MQRVSESVSGYSQCLGTCYTVDTECSAHLHVVGSSKMVPVTTCAPRSKEASKMATNVQSTAQQIAADLKWRFLPILERARESCKETVQEMWRDMCRGLAPNPDPLQEERSGVKAESPPTCAVTGQQTRSRHTEKRIAPPLDSTRGRGHKESQSGEPSPAKGGTGSESEELHFCMAFEEQGAETLNCSTPELTISEMNTTIYQLPGGLLVVEVGEHEYLRCLCVHCGIPGEVPSTKA
ncbi:hypothetical protein FKM82_024909 [Ascaphus truei]